MKINNIYCGEAQLLMNEIEPESIALSFWSPPYFLGKDYETGETFDSWQNLLKTVIRQH